MSDYRIDLSSGGVDFSSASIWAHAKADYLSGLSAQRVCDTYDLALSTFRTRARDEGWRRSDIPAADRDAPRDLAPAPPTAELVEQAWRSIADAIRRGKVYEARGWMRLVKELREEVAREKDVAFFAARRAEETPAGSEDVDTSAPDLHPLHPDREGAARPSRAPALVEQIRAVIAGLEARHAAVGADAEEISLLNESRAVLEELETGDGQAGSTCAEALAMDESRM